MAPGLKPIDALRADGDRPPRLERSPHPYFRTKVDSKIRRGRASSGSREASPTVSEAEDHRSASGSETHGASTPRTLSDSEVDAEDENFRFTKALPAPKLLLRKGLRPTEGPVVQETPLVTPDERSGSNGFFHKAAATEATQKRQDESKRAKENQKHKRRAEFRRRAAEVGSLGLISIAVLSNTKAWTTAQEHRQVLLYAIAGFGLLLCSYPGRLLWPKQTTDGIRFGSIRIPATFDPAPLLYPFVLPILTALSISSQKGIVRMNVVLGLSSLPPQLLPQINGSSLLNVAHWLITLLPLALSTNTHNKLSSTVIGRHEDLISFETYALLYPLHQCLLRPLYYLTTSSLLISELQLLSVSLINLLLLSDTPQALILTILLWVGGVGLLVLCNNVLRWNVGLERIPYRQPRRLSSTLGAGRSFFSALSENLNIHSGQPEQSHRRDRRKSDSKPDFVSAGDVRLLHWAQNTSEIMKSTQSEALVVVEDAIKTPVSPTMPRLSNGSPTRRFKHTRSMSMNVQWYLSLTPTQVQTRKWLYAIYSYAIMVTLILGPIRGLISSEALQGWEPFGWAIGYLFGNNSLVASSVKLLGLLSWIPIPQVDPLLEFPDIGSFMWVDQVRHVVGNGTTRLLLFGYWGVVIALGLLTVLKLLPEFAEVDTRRKVFHGMMVVMLLPTAFIDPCFLALGLSLVLAVFILLDLLRASQLPPLSKPLARFLAPYIDGRDLRGPIVVSHIFLLIGCAIPFWLSLADYDRIPSSNQANPWTGWELQPVDGRARDVSMLAGVICVGMGDAAASLIGRRFGRHKWPWAGGKSLEGSAAFAIAVTLGLMVGKAWLVFGGWQTTSISGVAWLTAAGKAVIAASGASFTEAVLTGANDNVIVPVILWLLVRGLDV